MPRLLFCLVFLLASAALAGDRTEIDRKAVASIASRLVRVETIGGHEKVGEYFANEGTGSAFLLDDGYVVTSAFHFLHDPSSILVRLSDDSKKVARRVCTDRNRMLTLLKVEGIEKTLTEKPLNVRNKDAIRLGRRCIAVGTALAMNEPNLAFGVVSGKDRIWGKALQTDAAVGPNNYGGPLLDEEGFLLGLLVPLSMTSADVTAGAEMYDAGVGMAIPFEDIMTMLPKMKEGNDLEPGELGVAFKENRTFIGEALIDAVQPESPAATSGLQKGDLILAIDGKPIRSALQATMDFRSRYAGETLDIRYRRNGTETNAKVTAHATSPKR